MLNEVIIGHKNPDTDSICSALALEFFKKQQNINAKAYKLGGINDETKFVLEYAKIDVPPTFENIDPNENNLVLVDHNEKTQSVDNRDDFKITQVIDHHRIANFETNEPLDYRCEVVGCTATILTKMFIENKIQIPQNIAFLLLSAIISDTLLFTSPTSTCIDKQMCEFLEKIARVDIKEYGIKMLKAGCNIKDKSAQQLINLDKKEFVINNKKYAVSQINLVDFEDIYHIKDQLLTSMNEQTQNNNYLFFLLLNTNILTSDTKALISGNSDIVYKSFDKEKTNIFLDLLGVVSRKKQVVPIINNYLDNN